MNKLTLLGTGCPSPSHLRYGPSSLVSYEGTNYLIDAGSGVTQRLSEVGIKPGEIDYFFITHLHSCLLYTSPSPRDVEESRMPSSA